MKRDFKSLSLIAENLAILYDNGVPIVLAIELLQEVQLNRNYKKSIIDIADRVKKGDSLFKAFSIYKSLYPDFFVALIALGEESGNLTDILKSLDNYYTKRRAIRSQIISSMIYPIFLIVIMLAVIIFFIFALLPSLVSAYKSIQSDMPFIIVKLVSVRKQILDQPIYICSYFVCYFVVIPFIIFKIFKSRVRLSNLLIKFKIVREFYEYILILNLAIIINSGLSLIKTISNCANSSEQNILKEELNNINLAISKGSSLSCAVEENKILSNKTKAMIKIGEVSGGLDIVITKLQQLLETNFNSNINKLLSRIQPAITIIMAALIGGFIFTVILPIFTVMYKK
jgi:type IV pilus assembly protein PilC